METTNNFPAVSRKIRGINTDLNSHKNVQFGKNQEKNQRNSVLHCIVWQIYVMASIVRRHERTYTAKQTHP